MFFRDRFSKIGKHGRIFGTLSVIYTAPKNIVLHVGTNNFYDAHDGVEFTEAALKRLLTYLHTTYPSSEIWWFNITQRTNTSYASQVTETNDYMVTVTLMFVPLGAFGFVSYMFYQNIGWTEGYLDLPDEEKRKCWPYCQVTIDTTLPKLEEAIEKGPYGRCVYHCDNNVVDHQVVNMEMENGMICNLTMSAFTRTGGRQLKIMGTLGDCIGDEEENTIRVGIYGKPVEYIDVRTLATDFSGHGGGDIRLIEDFLETIRSHGEVGGEHCVTTIENAIESHVMALAAEYSRLHGGEVVDLRKFQEENK